MIISVERCLPSIKDKLERKGYKVVFSDEYKHSVDAFIYSGLNESFGRHGLREYYGHDGLTPPFTACMRVPETAAIAGFESIVHGSCYHGGAIEINAAGKSFGEIEAELLEKRRASYF